MIVPFLTVALAATATQSPPAEERKACTRISPQIATILRKGVPAQRLDRLPPGRLELTVVREIEGCPIPAVMREAIGGARR